MFLSILLRTRRRRNGFGGCGMEGEQVSPPDEQGHHAITPSGAFPFPMLSTGGFHFFLETDTAVIYMIGV